jgi:hypothetical protein
METAATTISSALTHVYKAETVEALADKITEISGTLDREGYLSLLAYWKHEYASIAANVRATKAERKENPRGLAQSRRETLRRDARNLMAVRAALKEIARRHWATRQKAA